MGRSAEAECSHCGLKKRVVAGGGRSTYLTHSPWPVNCRACRDLTSANTRAEPLRCEACGSDDVGIIGDNKRRDPWTSKPSALQDFNYHADHGPHPCPRCGEVTLMLDASRGIMFD